MHSMYLHTSYIPNTLGPLTFHSELIEIYSLYYLQIFCGISRFWESFEVTIIYTLD
jgi:hypothetical protein